MCTLPLAVRVLLVLVLAAGTGYWSLWRVHSMEQPFKMPDAGQYLRMAQGRVASVPQPFASRPLAPLLAHEVARVWHLPDWKGFFALGRPVFGLTLVIVFGLATRTRAPCWLLLPLAVLPFWPLLLHGIALPDLWYAAVLGVFLLFLEGGRPLWAAVMLLPLMMSRESTTLVLLCLLLVGWRELRVPGVLLAVMATAVGSVIVHHLSAGAAANVEGLPGAVYLPAKLVWNGLRTLGFAPWSNLYPFLCGSPRWQHAVHLGRLHSIGVCTWAKNSPEEAGTAALTAFGQLPELLLVLLWTRRDVLLARWRSDLLLRFALLYGGVAFALTPLLGTAYERLFGYGWPLFLVAVPRLFTVASRSAGNWEPAAFAVAGAFVAAHWVLAVYALDFPTPFGILWLAGGLGTALLALPVRRFLTASAARNLGTSVVN